MSQLIIPEGYRSLLTLRQTQIAIKKVKDFFQQNLAVELNLTRVSAPLFVSNRSGLNDNLNGHERPVSFDVKDDGVVAEIYPAEGELVGIGTPLLTIVDIAKPYAVLNVREDMMPLFKLGQIIRCDVPAIATTDIAWEIYYIAPLGSYATWRTTHLAEGYDMRTFEVHARPTEHIEGLYPGMSILLSMENVER